MIERIFDIFWKVVTWLPLTLWSVITDTLQEKGKWSENRIAGFSGFFAGIAYAFIPIWFEKFPVHEFVFWGFITFGAGGLGIAVWKLKVKNDNE